MSWIKTYDCKPTDKQPTTWYPFASTEHDDPHSGYYLNGRWWCSACDRWIDDSEIEAWFDLPPYEP